MNGALEAIEGVGGPAHRDEEGFVVFVSASGALWHGFSVKGVGREAWVLRHGLPPPVVPVSGRWNEMIGSVGGETGRVWQGGVTRLPSRSRNFSSRSRPRVLR